MAEITKAFPGQKVEAELVKGANGILEIEVDGKNVFSKDKEKRWPAYREIPERIKGIPGTVY